jgi:glutaredoxin
MADGSEDGFRFFKSPEIDYWGGPGDGAASPTSTPPSSRPPKPATAVGTFKWEKYLSPQHDEFFREGDYTPPAPFLEIARNPSDENIENWFRYIELKNQTLRRLQARLSEFAGRHGQALPAGSAEALRTSSADLRAQLTQADAGQVVAELKRRTPSASAEPRDARRFRIRMYFDSKCPHCERMMGTLAELRQRGYYVELRQVDSDMRARARIPFPVQDAPRAELAQYGVSSVPVLVVGDFERKTYFKIQGYQTTTAVLQALAEAESREAETGTPARKSPTKREGVSNEDERMG